jgi:cysteine-rich repeat protein
MTHETKRRGRTILTAALLFVTALVSPLAAQIPPCGDGLLDLGEECDEGLATGAPDSCCAIDCTFRPALTPCRDTTGECDPADVCSGTSGTCDDVKRTDVCRPAAGVCDVEESCDGVANACPADGFQPDETPCNDGNSCSSHDRCVDGICGGFLESCGNGTTEEICAEECDDGNQTPGDGCTANCHLEPCGPDPFPGCRAPTIAGKAAVQIVARLNPENNKLQWKYSPGETTPKADFGDPTTTTSYQFCIWEEVAGDPRLSAIPAGGTCGVGPCWKPSSFGFRYTDKSRASDGIAGLNLKQGLDPGKTRIILQGKGSDLPLPVLPFIQGPNVVMQLRASNGVCWEARYDMPAFRNQPEQFRDK